MEKPVFPVTAVSESCGASSEKQSSTDRHFLIDETPLTDWADIFPLAFLSESMDFQGPIGITKILSFYFMIWKSIA
ncbi:MAG: hypothetical protein SOV63_07375 [Pyramidobacter porci]|nr:hypothetical protein [Pyramidobacter porci]